MDLRIISVDFFTIGNIVVLTKDTGNNVYDFNFRNNFDCKSVVSEVDALVLLHIGAIDDYAGKEAALEEMGMKLLVHEAEHLRCSTIEKWYSTLKDKTLFIKLYEELPEAEDVTFSEIIQFILTEMIGSICAIF